MLKGPGNAPSRVWLTDPDDTLSELDLPGAVGPASDRLASTQDDATPGASEIKGQFIGINGITAHGWAYDPNRPDEPLTIEILEGEQLIASGVADQFRSDAAAFIDGPTHCGFRIRIPNEYLDGRELKPIAREASSGLTLESERPPVLRSAHPGWSATLTDLQEETLNGEVEIQSTDADESLELELWIDGLWADRFHVPQPGKERASIHVHHTVPDSIRDGETWTSVFDGEVHEFVLTLADSSLILASAEFPTPVKAYTYEALQTIRAPELSQVPRFVRRFIDRAVASALFDADFYSAKVKEDFPSRERAVLHYLSDRKHWRHATSPWMDVAFITAQAGDITKEIVSPLEWYLRQGADSDVGPNPLFSNADYRVYAERTAARRPIGASFFDDWLETVQGRNPIKPSALVDLGHFSRTRHGAAKKTGERVLVDLQDWLRSKPKDRPLGVIGPYFDQDWLEQCFVLRQNRPQTCLLSAFRLGLLNDQSPHPVLQYTRDGRNYYALIREYELLSASEGIDDITRVCPGIDSRAFYTQFPPNTFKEPRSDDKRSSFCRYFDAGSENARRSFLRGLDDDFVANEYAGLTEYCTQHRGIADINRIWSHWLRLMGLPGNYVDSIASDRGLLSISDIRELRSHKTQAGDSVRASFIIPTYARDDLVLKCVLSALQCGNAEQIEFLIAEDAEHVDANWILGYFLPYASLHKNPKNLGFLLSCKNAVARSNGSVFILVNNDVILHKDALKELLATFDSRDDAAVVGGLVLNADGTVQENSGMLWQDGSAWNYHRNLKLDEEYAFNTREADYVSGCWIGIRRRVWDQIGGFDERYVPAYYEESDFCLSAWRHGYKVYVNPLSVVTHLDGATMGQDENNPASLKSFQKINQQKFHQKWQQLLAATHNPNGQPTPFHTGRVDSKRFISLIFDHYIPEPDRDAGSRTMFAACQAMAAMPNNYVLFVPANGHRSAYAAGLERVGIEIVHNHEGWKWFNNLIENRNQLVKYVLVSRIQVAEKFRWHLDKLQCRKSLYIHDIEALRSFQHDPNTPGYDSLVGAAIKTYAAKYKALFSGFDDIISLSEDETRLLKPYFGAQLVDVFPYDFKPQDASSATERNDIIFVGSYNHPPNREAIGNFVRTIWPKLQKRLPGARLHLCGSGFEQATDLSASHNVVLHGMVSDQTLAYIYSICRVSIAPLVSGAGMKGKVIEACSHGVPCVGTELAWQGLALPEKFKHLTGSIATFQQRLQKTYRGYTGETPLELQSMYTSWRDHSNIREVIPSLVEAARLR